MVPVFSFTNACTNSGEPIYADHPLHLHDVPGGVVVDSEDVLEAVERLIRGSALPPAPLPGSDP